MYNRFAYVYDELINDVKPKRIIPVHTENAKWFDKYRKVSDHIEITGRIQSRRYPKHCGDSVQMLETYEVSVITIQMF